MRRAEGEGYEEYRQRRVAERSELRKRLRGVVWSPSERELLKARAEKSAMEKLGIGSGKGFRRYCKKLRAAVRAAKAGAV